jgi:beta-lactamase regulating signal transducer with metallopeptidase domain
MFAWIACVLLASAVLGLAALLAEQACRLRRLATRWPWFVAMALSVLLPFAVPRLVPRAALPLPALVARLAPDSPQPGPVVAARAGDHPGTHVTLGVLVAQAPLAWLLLSLAVLAALAGSTALLRRRACTWRRTHIEGTEILVSPSTGPAVFGWWQPRIVLPEWLGAVPTRQRSLALEHERSHLRARDPQWLAVALLLLAAMPWNLPMWWQLRRLRCAIEVDCDRRVLEAGGDLVDYCETLIELSQHPGMARGLMAAVAEPISLLERRIRIMSAATPSWSRLVAGACLALALCTVAAAAVVSPGASSDRAFAPTPPSLAALPAPPAPPVPAAPPAPPARAAAATRPTPPTPPVRPRRPALADEAIDESQLSPEQRTAYEAKRAAEEAMEHAQEAKADAEAAEADAQEAKREAEQQAAAAMQAKQEAEQAAAEAQSLKAAAEAAEAAANTANARFRPAS